MNKSHYLKFIYMSGIFLIADQIFKYLARTNPDYYFYILKPWLGWELMLNDGIAFSIPVPAIITTLITPLIIMGLIFYWTKNKQKSNYFYFGIILIIAGAISNLIDRITFGITIDYLRLFFWVINLADVMVVAGAGLLVWSEIKQK